MMYSTVRSRAILQSVGEGLFFAYIAPNPGFTFRLEALLCIILTWSLFPQIAI